MNKVFVTGSYGDIGTHLVNGLISKGYTVLESVNSKVRIEEDEYFEAIKNPESIDVLYHLAGKKYVPLSWEKPDEFIKSNIYGTSKVLEFCRKYNIKIIFISSYAYGIPQYLPIDENHAVLSVNPYALSKKMAEELCVFYGKNYDLAYNIIRPFNVYGSLKNKSLLIPEIISQILDGGPIKIKDLAPKRDYLHIDDMVEFLIISQENIMNEIYNLGSGLSYSVKDIIDMCQSVYNTNYEIISSETIRKNEIPETISSIKKIENVFNWNPKISLKEGLFKMKNEIENSLK